ncbi:hypothetical protein GJ496_004714 [Pomphorhynchus laevis]|nr:hypothetical protein GJ496_004714 [Pomphorhynchus laevis]
MDKSSIVRTSPKRKSNLIGSLIIAGITCLIMVFITLAVALGVGINTYGISAMSAHLVAPPNTTNTT